MRLAKTLMISTLSTVLYTLPALAQTTTAAPAAPCSDTEYHQFDFWVGDWDLSWKNPDGSTSKGRNLVSKTPYGDCVITENFDGVPAIVLKGMSVSTYSKPHGKWRQTWVDNSGGYFALSGGPEDDGTFILTMERLGDKGPHSRMVFKDIEKDSLTWHWQGKRKAEDDWADQWVIKYTRR